MNGKTPASRIRTNVMSRPSTALRMNRHVRHADEEGDRCSRSEADERECRACDPTRARANQPATKAAGDEADDEAERLATATYAGPAIETREDRAARPGPPACRSSALAAPRAAPSEAPTMITPSVCPVIGTGPMKNETFASRRDQRDAGQDERGVDGERAGARGRTRDDVGENATSGRCCRIGGDRGHGSPSAGGPSGQR